MSEAEIIVEEMTDEQLEAAINPPETPAEKTPSVPQEEEKAETPPNTTETAEPSKEVKKEVAPESKPPEEEIVQITKSEWEKTQKRIEDKEKFIQRQAQEVGQRRKSEEQLRAEIFTLEQKLVEKQYEPLEARAIQKELDVREAQLGEAELSKRFEANRNTVKAFVPELEAYIDDVVAILKEDGQPEEAIRAFRENPYSEHPGVIVNLTKRAELARTLRNKDAEIASLKAENAALKAKPQEVVKKIEQALKQPTAMTNDSGQATSVKASIDESQIPLLSDAELDRAIKESSA